MTKRKRGHFITLEGGEGTGKSTQTRRLAAALEMHDISCVLTREPGGSPGAEEIRDLLVNGEPGRWDVLTETLMLYAARADHVTRTIKPALAEGRWVLCDRFSDSSYAYQGAGRGLDRETVRRIESVAIGDFKPELTLVLDLPAEEGLKRAHARASSESRFEKFDVEFHERLRQAFLDIAKRNGDRCRVIDASGDEDTVAHAILDAVKTRFGLS
ncbi:MAG: dTMP kinase [Alphaproteobacteria bacterium]|nr:dTMP kinase [Alphaproteobacteria bacterium]MDE2161907.1 dTMP kinase [Alphaproteobacteria bacterium]MDE2264505.1 dTMP kinase [Alphaproteobacteria bacterium]MDE2500820.1 dTMP kinase [Alphaproteobacteria bacterium]